MATTPTGIRARVHAPPACLDQVTSVLALTGLRPSATADVALLVTDHDDPSVADSWAVDSLPHLVVRLGATSMRIGPFVHPGVTACLRCLDAAGAPVEPHLTSYAAVDRALVGIALGWAVRDLVTWRAGGLPTTWSATVSLDAALTPSINRWLRHPHCGCSWGQELAAAMGMA